MKLKTKIKLEQKRRDGKLGGKEKRTIKGDGKKRKKKQKTEIEGKREGRKSRKNHSTKKGLAYN